MCRTPEEFKAWSQNLGHEQVLTTFSSYGEMAAAGQAGIIHELGSPLMMRLVWPPSPRQFLEEA